MLKRFVIEYYQRHNNIKTAYIYAESKAEALKELRRSDAVVEVISCREVAVASCIYAFGEK